MNVENPMKTMEIRKVYLRPVRSPSLPEEHGAERPHDETRGIGRECGEQRGGFVLGREEELREKRRQHRIEIKVVPFEDGPGR